MNSSRPFWPVGFAFFVVLDRGFAFGLDAFLDDRLRGDAGMVGAGDPDRVVAKHASPADEDVLERVVERVAQVQRCGDVWRRDHDAIRLSLDMSGFAWKGIGVCPGAGRPAGFDLGGVVSCCQFFGHNSFAIFN